MPNRRGASRGGFSFGRDNKLRGRRHRPADLRAIKLPVSRLATEIAGLKFGQDVAVEF